MNVNIEKISESSRKIKIEIPKERVNKEFNKVYSELRSHAEIPGFRPGKVPKSVLKMRLGDAVARQVGADLIEESYSEAMKKIEDDIAGYPEINEWTIKEDEAFSFEITVEVIPEIELQNYKGMEVPKRSVEISDEEIEAGLKRVQESQSTYEVVDDRAAAEGDRVYCRVTFTVDDEIVPGWKNRPVEVDIGQNKFFPDTSIEEQFIGLESDSEKTITAEFPKDYEYYKDLAGKTVEVTVNVNEIKTRQIPEIDDELAKDAGLGNLDELKEMIKEDILKTKKQEIETEFENKIFESIQASNTISVPEPMVESEAELMVKNYFSYQGELSEEHKNSLIKSMKPMAESRVIQRLILQRVAELENIEVNDEDVDNACQEMAQTEIGKPAEEIRKEMEDDDMIPRLKKQLARSKALTFLKDNVKVVEASDEQPEDNAAEMQETPDDDGKAETDNKEVETDKE